MPNNYDAFVKAYNNFDSRPLSKAWGKDFYVDDFTKVSNRLTKEVELYIAPAYSIQAYS